MIQANSIEPWVLSSGAVMVNRFHVSTDEALCRIAVGEQVGPHITCRGVVGLSLGQAKELAETILLSIQQVQRAGAGGGLTSTAVSEPAGTA